MEDRDIFSELIKSKLENHESVVSPKAWNAVNSTISPVSSVFKLGLLKIAAVVLVAATATVSLIIYSTKPELDNPVPKGNQVKIPANTSIENALAPTNVVLDENNPSRSKDVVHKEEELPTNSVLPEIPLLPQHKESEVYLTETKNETNYIPVASAPVMKNTEVVTKPVLTTPIEEEPLTVKDELSSKKLSLPNVFTPNNDGVNDVLELQLDVASDFSVVVMDRFNKVIYQSSDSHFSWDGSNLDGTKVPAGDYVYYVVGKDANGKTLTAYSYLRIQY